MTIKRDILESAPGVSPAIGFYLAGMQEIRAQVEKLAGDLTPEELCARPIPGFNCIGALLLHVAENDFWWIQSLAGGVEMTGEIEKQVYWDILDDEDFASRGYTSEFCLAEMARISKGSKEALGKFSDEDLETLFAFDGRTSRVEVSLRWILHHLIDHEAHHKGQIALIKKHIRKSA
jgi:uncharacterized damage-inducible protein DinB